MSTSVLSKCDCGPVATGECADAEVIQRVWNGFHIREATPADYPAIVAHLRTTYYREESNHKLLGWCEKKGQDLDLVVHHLLHHGLSLVALDPAKNRVAGVRLMIDIRRNLDFTKLPFQSPHIMQIIVAKNHLLSEYERRMRESDPYFDPKKEVGIPTATGFIASTDPAYRGCGLASELHALSLIHCRRAGIRLIRSFFSTEITVRIAQKLGYTYRSHHHLAELLDEKGQRLFPTAPPPPAHCNTYMVLKLE